MARRLRVEADGGSRGNPGPAGYGALVRDATTGELLAERAAGIGRATNNVAEYRGLIAGLRAAAEIGPGAEVEVAMDSKLVVEQMSGRWKVKHPDMAPLAREAADVARGLGRVRYGWVPRAQNGHADRLANEAMDAAAAGRTWQPPPSLAPTVPGPPSPVDAPPDPAPPGAAPAPVTGGRTPLPGWSGPAGAATTTLLLRHGQTPMSAEKRFSGTGDPALTPLGLAQAAAAATALAARAGLDAVISSPLTRARQTAAELGERVGLPVEVDDGLRETDFGAWEGFTFADIRRRWPDELTAWLADPAVPPPGGESFAATYERVRMARDRVLGAHPGATVVVVSHVTPIKTLVRMALSAPPSALYALHLDLTSVSTVDWYADGPAVLRGFNDTHHLDALPPG